MSVNMINRSPLSPFHLNAASTISGLKHVQGHAKKPQGPHQDPPLHKTTPSASQTKANKTLATPGGTRVDTDMKTAASALTNLAALIASNSSDSILPNGDKNGKAAAVETPLAKKDPSSLKQIKQQESAALPNNNKGGSKPAISTAAAVAVSAKTGVQFHRGVAPTRHPHPYHHHRYPPRPPHHPHHHHAHYHLPSYSASRPYHCGHGSSHHQPTSSRNCNRSSNHPASFRRMVPNPIGWQWPMVPAHPNRDWPAHVIRNSNFRDVAKPGGAEAANPAAKRKQRPDGEWTDADEERLAKLEHDYKYSMKKRKQSDGTAVTIAVPTEEEPEEERKSSPALSPVEPEVEFHASVNLPFLKPADNAIRKKRTTWTKEEDAQLKSIVPKVMEQEQGLAVEIITTNTTDAGSSTSIDQDSKDKICWSTVSRMMPGRDSKQCRDRWLNHLDPTVQRNANKPWTEEEDRKLVSFIQKHGTRWRLMQGTILADRTELTIKNRWNSAMKRRYTRYLSRRWVVPEQRIQLINKRGLLAPGVDIEQMLKVARCKMSEVAYHCGEPTSDKAIVLPEEGEEQASGANAKIDDGKPKLPSVHPGFYSIRVIIGRITDDSYQLDLGDMEIPVEQCFASTRKCIDHAAAGKLDKSAWLFSVPKLGILTARQEVDLGPMINYLGTCGKSGTPDHPFELTVVEP